MGTLQLNGVRKTFGDTVAVDDMTLEVGDGEFFVILGPSGAGKTTTLKSVAGLVDIDAGKVAISGQDMTGVEPYHRNVAMAFESYALYPQKTVAQNLASPLRSGRSGTFSEAEQKQRIDQVTTTLGINHLLGRLPRELSNGQRQRTALGRVLVRPADIYLLDEPLSHLDAKLRAAMRAELKALGQMSSTTTLYVTHDYQEALSLGDRVGVMKRGRLVHVDTPHRIWRQPKDTFVAKALGQPEMNLLPAIVDEGEIRLASGHASFPVPQGLSLQRGQKLLLGVRPNELEVDRGQRSGDGYWRLDGHCVLAERLGRNVELDLHLGDDQVIAIDGADHDRVEGQDVRLVTHLSHVHVFDASTDAEDAPRIGSGLGPDPQEDRS